MPLLQERIPQMVSSQGADRENTASGCCVLSYCKNSWRGYTWGIGSCSHTIIFLILCIGENLCEYVNIITWIFLLLDHVYKASVNVLFLSSICWEADSKEYRGYKHEWTRMHPQGAPTMKGLRRLGSQARASWRVSYHIPPPLAWALWEPSMHAHACPYA